MAETEPPSLGPVSSRDQSSPLAVDDSLLREPPVDVISIQDDEAYILSPHGAFPIEHVTEDGGVLKSIVHHGQGPVVPLHATCLVHYAGRIVSNGDVFMNSRDVRERGRGEPVHVVAGRGMRLFGCVVNGIYTTFLPRFLSYSMTYRCNTKGKRSS